MSKISVKRMLLAAAAASSLAAVVVPQAASAAEVRCSGASNCTTAALQANNVTRTVRHAVTAYGLLGFPVLGAFEVRDVQTGVRVNGGNFFGSASGQTGGLFSQYNLRVSGLVVQTTVTGRLWTP